MKFNRKRCEGSEIQAFTSIHRAFTKRSRLYRRAAPAAEQVWMLENPNIHTVSAENQWKTRGQWRGECFLQGIKCVYSAREGSVKTAQKARFTTQQPLFNIHHAFTNPSPTPNNPLQSSPCLHQPFTDPSPNFTQQQPRHTLHKSRTIFSYSPTWKN